MATKQRRNKVTGRIERLKEKKWIPISDKEQLAIDTGEGVGPVQAGLIEAGRQTQGVLGLFGGDKVPERSKPALDRLRETQPVGTLVGSTLPGFAIPAVGPAAQPLIKLGQFGFKAAANKQNTEKLPANALGKAGRQIGEFLTGKKNRRSLTSAEKAKQHNRKQRDKQAEEELGIQREQEVRSSVELKRKNSERVDAYLDDIIVMDRGTRQQRKARRKEVFAKWKEAKEGSKAKANWEKELDKLDKGEGIPLSLRQVQQNRFNSEAKFIGKLNRKERKGLGDIKTLQKKHREGKTTPDEKNAIAGALSQRKKRIEMRWQTAAIVKKAGASSGGQDRLESFAGDVLATHPLRQKEEFGQVRNKPKKPIPKKRRVGLGGT